MAMLQTSDEERQQLTPGICSQEVGRADPGSGNVSVYPIPCFWTVDVDDLIDF